MRGAGSYVCGEETGLIASVQDARGMPRTKPPFPAASGIYYEPTNVNNVESYANVPLILRNGGEWFRELGTEKASGTKIFSFSGDVRFTGFSELPWGVPLPDVLKACGGISEGGRLKALQAGGPLAGYLSADGRRDADARTRRIPSTRRTRGGGRHRLRLGARLLHRPERDVRGVPGG